MDDVLRRAPLFAALDDEQAAELRASMSEVTLARGDALFHEGDPGDRLYVVTEGKVKLHTRTYGLDQINDAIDEFMAGHIHGRGVIVPDGRPAGRS